MSHRKKDPSANPRNKLIIWMLLLSIVLVGSGLSLHRLGAKSLWEDEITTVQIASKNYHQIHESLKYTHMAPPLYYIVLHVFLNLGSNEFFVRLPSVIFFVLSIIACFLVAQILFDDVLALFAAFFFTLSSLQISYAQEARMYSMCQLFVLLSFYFFIKTIQSNKMIFWVAYLIVTIMSAYTHYFALFYMGIQALFLIITTLRQRILLKKENKAFKIDFKPWFWFVLSIIGIFILYLPKIPSLLARTKGAGLHQSFSTAFNLTWRIFSGSHISGLPYIFGIVFVWGLAACWISKKRTEGILLGLWVFLPLPMVYLFLMRAESFFAVRYILFSNPPYLIGISFGLVYLIRLATLRLKLSNLVQKIVYTSLVLSIIFVHISSIQAMYNQPKQPIRELAHFFNEQVEEDEVLFISPRWHINSLNYYGFQSNKVFFSTLKRDDIENLLRKKTDTWLLSTSTYQFNPDRAFRPYIENGKCIKIFGGTYQTTGLYLYYLRLDENHPRDILPILEAAIHFLPKDWYVHASLAKEYRNRGKIRYAIFEYEKALDLEPKKMIFMIKLAQLYVQNRRFKSGIRILKQAIDLVPSNAENHIFLADIFMREKNFDDALSEYKKAGKLDPAHYKKDWFYVRLGNIYKLKKDKVRAVEAYEKALALNKNNKVALENLARLKH